MDFFLFVVVTGVMLVRPGDFVPALNGVNLYLFAIVCCMLVSWNRLISRLSTNAFREDPTAIMVMGIFLVSLVSNLAHGDFATAREFGTEFGKVVLFYLLLIGIVDSPTRLRRFVSCVVVFDLIPTTLALLQFHEIIYIPALVPYNDQGLIRLTATGFYGDPNDFCEMLNTAMLFSLYRLMDGSNGVARFVWLTPIPAFGYALALTRSRGGLLGAVAGLGVMFWSRYGVKKTVVVAGLGLPIMLYLGSGRLTSISTSEGTSQQRIQLWAEGFEMLRESPIWGIGTDQFGKRAGLAAHNSFVHAYAELGLVGGMCFFGMYYYLLASLGKLGSPPHTVRDPILRHARPYIMAAVTSCAVSEMSLSRCYLVTTYVIIGIGSVCVRMTRSEAAFDDPQPDRRLAYRLIRDGLVFLAALYVFTRLSVRW